MTLFWTLLKRILLAMVFACAAYITFLSIWDENYLPDMENGDLVFQTSWTDQSIAIMLASGSLYIHTGVVSKNGDEYTVIEAARQVTETPMKEWVRRGILKRFSVYHYKGLTPEQGSQIVEAARRYIGKPYDFYFYPGTDAIYCSELDYLAYNDSGVPLGTPEKIGSLNINNPFVKKIIEQRWRDYPACKGADITFESCYSRIMEGDLVTPGNIASDPHLEKIYSNYP